LKVTDLLQKHNAAEAVRAIQLSTAGRISLKSLMDLLNALPAPLGIRGQTQSYIDQSNVCRNVLLCMPVDKPKEGHQDVPLFDEAFLPMDLGMVFTALEDGSSDNLKKTLVQMAGSANQTYVVEAVDSMFKNLQHGFSFTQVLIAVHKRVVLYRRTNSEMDDARKLAGQRLRELRHRVARAVVANKPIPRGVSSAAGYYQLQLLQRMDQELYRRNFIEIMGKGINSIAYRTNAFQISQFDLFFMNKLRLALQPEVASAQLQLKLSQVLATPGCSDAVLKKRSLTKQHFWNLRKLNKQMEDLYSMNANNTWEISSIIECYSMSAKSGVTALAVDAKSTIYAAFDNGDLKIYCTSRPENLKPVTFSVQQKLTLEQEARCLTVTPDGKILMAGIGNSIAIFGWKAKRKFGRPQFAEMHRFSGHSDVANFVIPHGPFNISGAMDGYILLWDLNTETYIKSYNAGSAVYCGVRINSPNELTSPELAGLPDMMVCGTRNGQLVLVGLPALKGGSGDIASSYWPAVTQSTSTAEGLDVTKLVASSVAVTALAVCWGYLFVGLADGSVQTWSFALNKTITYELVGLQFVKRVDIVRVHSVAWHAGPVTSIQLTGGYMFTGSYDYSILPWCRPEKQNVTQSVQYAQSTMGGLVMHTSPITAMGSNRFQLVSANQDGKIIVTVPRVINDVTALGASSALFEPDVTKYLKFSFLSYDFGPCFIKHQKMVMRERTVLSITNTYTRPLTLQVTAARQCPQFDFQFEHSINPVDLLSQVTESKTSKSRDIISILPFQTINFTILFVPEDEVNYLTNFEFLIESKKTVTISVKGTGVKPFVLVNGMRTFDFGTCIANSGGRKKLTLTLENPTPKDILVNTLDVEITDKDGNGTVTVPDYEDISHVSMKNRDITILPECFILKGNGSMALHIAFRPRREYLPFEIDIRLHYCGATYTVGKILGRSEVRDGPGGGGGGENGGGDAAVPTTAMDKLITHGLRPLLPVESVLMVTKGPILTHALRDIGWTLSERNVFDENDNPKNGNEDSAGTSKGFSEKVTCLMHQTTGVFIEFPPDMYLKTRKPQRSAVDRLQIRFDNKNASQFYYAKLRHGRNTISLSDHVSKEGNNFAFSGRKFEALDDFTRVIKKRIDELFLRDEEDERAHERMHDNSTSTDYNSEINAGGSSPDDDSHHRRPQKAQQRYQRPGNPDLVGYSTIELILATNDDFDAAETVITFYIRVQRGFRIQKTNQYESTDNIAMSDRINIIGFERVVTLRRIMQEKKGSSKRKWFYCYCLNYLLV
jgi:WD40 repeat protein